MMARQKGESLSFGELCEVLGKPPLYISTLQRILGVYIPPAGEVYYPAYVSFMEKVVALRTFNIPAADIAELFGKEKRLLELMRFDALSDSPTWYLDGCGAQRCAGERLMLTGYSLGFSLDAKVIQPNLDFGDRGENLFKGHEMGEDVSRSLALYRKIAQKMRERVEKEIPVLRNALYWGERVF